LISLDSQKTIRERQSRYSGGAGNRCLWRERHATSRFTRRSMCDDSAEGEGDRPGSLHETAARCCRSGDARTDRRINDGQQ
jgi:hypothetical protein